MLTSLRRYFSGQVRHVVVGLILANLFVIALVAVSLHASYTQYLERAAVISRNTNRLVAQSIHGEIDRIDMALLAVQDEYARLRAAGRMDQPGLKSFLKHQQERLPMIDSLRIADARGNVVVGGDEASTSGITIADRDYFLVLKKNHSNVASSGLVISPPVLGRISGKWVLIFARSLSRADGGFDGIIYAPVTIEWFNQKFVELEVGPRGAVVLRGNASRDFDLLARYPQAGFVGQTKVSPQFTALITAHPKSGTYEAKAGADNIRRIFSYQAVGNYPLITLVGLSTEDTLAQWWPEVVKLSALAAVFTLLTALGGWLVVRAWNARAQAYENMHVLNEELVRDNSARRQAEAEITRLNAELEQRVRERTVELENANKGLEAFSYSVSHDLRAPLRAIDGFSRMLEEDYQDKLDTEGLRLLNVVRTNTERMGVLIDDVLEFSRMGRRDMQASDSVDMNRLVGEITEELQSAAAGPALRFEIAELPLAQGDSAMIRQVLVNLLSNAVKFTRMQPQAIIVVGGQAQAGENLYFVKDNGVGFDMQYVEKLFGVFSRLHATDEFEGTGIGLAIVKRIIERHGGRVWAQGNVGEGATFYFTLPHAMGSER
ncbi:MAG: Signal transduction histidine kinase [Comamonadaceae bacterium]|nr:MAG: Signal transduction histidine kinase [Comamonadaceae bacterium]